MPRESESTAMIAAREGAEGGAKERAGPGRNARYLDNGIVNAWMLRLYAIWMRWARYARKARVGCRREDEGGWWRCSNSASFDMQVRALASAFAFVYFDRRPRLCLFIDNIRTNLYATIVKMLNLDNMYVRS